MSSGNLYTKSASFPFSRTFSYFFLTRISEPVSFGDWFLSATTGAGSPLTAIYSMNFSFTFCFFFSASMLLGPLRFILRPMN